MQNKFGLKDFVLLVVMLAVGVSVWLGMVQRDLNRDELLALRSKLGDVERQLSRVESTLQSGVPAAAAPAAAQAQASPSRDESWARPGGVPVQWQPPVGYATDPRSVPGFRIGGTFTEIFEVQPAKITPSIQTDVYGKRAVDMVMETLGTYDPKTLRIRGLLADAWQMDPKGLWLRVHIRENARFSDGTPVTAEDFRWTFHDFIMNPQIEAQRDRSTLEDTMEAVKVISPQVVEFTFKKPNFLNLDNALTMYAMPAHFYSKFQPAEINKSTGLLMGSGPFKLERLDPARQWAPPEDVVLVRNEQYWAAKPPLEKIRLKAINEELARLTEYKKGEADMITPAAPQFVAGQQDPEFAAGNQMISYINMRSGRSGLIWNCGPRNGKLTPFHDVRVRQAMTYLLDREKMVRDIWKGMGEVAASFFNVGTPSHNPDLKPYPYDPARGKALLKEAGWEDRNNDGVLEDENGNPFVFELTYFGGGEIAERIATFVKDAYASAGIRVNLRGMDWSVGDPVRDQRDFDCMMMGWGASAPESDPKQIFHSDSIKDQGDNFGQWSSPAADAAIDAARLEMDFDKRQTLWWEFERIMAEEQPYTWVRVQPYTRIAKPDIGNLRQYPKGIEYPELFRASGPLPMAVK
jgi:peptide/nickel transport system substrate-binding protein